MKGILIIAHGSRRKETLDTMEEVFAMVQENMPDIIVEHAYMEFCDVNLEKGLDLLRERGVDEIVVAKRSSSNGNCMFRIQKKTTLAKLYHPAIQ